MPTIRIDHEVNQHLRNIQADLIRQYQRSIPLHIAVKEAARRAEAKRHQKRTFTLKQIENEIAGA